MKTGTWTNLIALLGGVWIWLAPTLTGYAPKHGSPWAGLILGSDIMAGVVVVVSLVGLAGFWHGYLSSAQATETES